MSQNSYNPALYIKKRYWHKFSITKKLFLLTVITGVVLWYPIDYLQNKQLQSIFFNETKKELVRISEVDRRLFDQKIQIHHNATKLITSQNRFQHYLGNLSTTEQPSEIKRSYAGRPAHWLPRTSIMRSFFSARFALLLSAQGNIVEIYHHNTSHNGSESESDILKALTKSGYLLRKLSHSQSYLTKLNNFPFVFSTESIKVNGNKWYLMLVSPIDEQFLSEVTKLQARRTILALLEPDSNKIIVSSDEQKIPSGESFSSFSSHYVQTGKSFFDYGASDLDLQLISAVSLNDANYMTNLIMEKGRQQRLLLAVVLIILFIIVGFWYSSGLQHLSHQIAHIAQRLISKTHNKNLLKNSINGDELIALNLQFTSLADELEQKSNLQNISEQELIRAKNEAEAANYAKSKFLSSMSHELRTPLNAIIGFAQLFEYDPKLSHRQKENAQEINKAGKHLLSLVNDILNLAKIEAGQTDLVIEPLAINTMFSECYTLIEPLAMQRNIKFVVDECDTIVLADAIRLKQVILNLLTNAVKYNQENGEVRLYCDTANKNYCRIYVSDTGSGIKFELQKFLFEPFQRLGKELSNIEGSGIGLSIAKQLIEIMNGKIGVDCIDGTGCTFWLEIPLAGTLPIKEAKAELNNES
ncbi:MAG: hypothetical protein GQ546_09800 [Gammaproteobacteria bacterium]|nr:hypothetical protein [Gammaproteobacteria bacterium]